jgi:hypothetical protein
VTAETIERKSIHQMIMPTIDGRRVQFVTCLDEELHDLGDHIHEQVTEFDDSDETSPGRYAWAIHPSDRAVILCCDRVTGECRAGPINDDTEVIAQFIHEALRMTRGGLA